MKNILTSFLLIVLVFSSCNPIDPNKEIDEGSVKGENYKSKEIGWSIEIPKGWKIMTRDKIESSGQKGNEALEKTIGQPVDTKFLKHLISFQKDPFNIFMSSSEPFDEEFPGEFQVNNKQLYEILYQTFIDQGIKVDTTSGKEQIQNLEFETFHTTIYSPKGEIIMNQVLYSRLINGFSFGVTICYNNLADKTTLIETFKNSKFE